MEGVGGNREGKKRSWISPLVTSGNEGRSRSCLSAHLPRFELAMVTQPSVLIPVKGYAMTNAFTVTAVRLKGREEWSFRRVLMVDLAVGRAFLRRVRVPFKNARSFEMMYGKLDLF